jgi:choline dehydrogenase-like flavoprotein
MTATDVVVVGSGPCGAMAARELVRLGVTVTMLDAGFRPVRGVLVRAAGNTVFRWAEPSGLLSNRHVAAGDPKTEWISSWSLGGLSNYWSAAVPRMSPDDFTDGAGLDERFRWPISYRDLEPYYGIVERAMLVTAGESVQGVPPGVKTFDSQLRGDWAPFVGRVSDNGHGIGVMPMAKGRPWMAALRPTGFNSYYCLLKPLLRDPRFRLVRGAVALRVDSPRGPGREASVEFFERTTRARRVVRCRAVVVAAGTLDSAKLLLQSRTDDFPDGLGNSGGLVGRYLHDHARQWWPARLERPMPLLAHPIYIARTPVGEGAPLMASSLTLGMAESKERIRSWYGGSSDLIGVQVFGTIVPSEEFTVRLTNRRPADEPTDEPLEVCIRYDDQVLNNMVSARDRFGEIFVQAGLKATPQGPFHEIRPGSSVHYGGTIRMHADPRFGVLDRWNRVYDCPNVVVCDASCFPTGPEKNPTLTAMAIAGRAAHRLAADLNRGGQSLTDDL